SRRTPSRMKASVSCSRAKMPVRDRAPSWKSGRRATRGAEPSSTIAQGPAMRLQGRVAIVSGSGRGIGRATALALAREGARVVVNDLDASPAEEVVSAIRGAGGEAVACVGSVTESGFADRFVGMAIERFSGLDVIVNNAGYTWDTVIQKMTDEQFDA